MSPKGNARMTLWTTLGQRGDQNNLSYWTQRWDTLIRADTRPNVPFETKQREVKQKLRNEMLSGASASRAVYNTYVNAIGRPPSTPEMNYWLYQDRQGIVGKVTSIRTSNLARQWATAMNGYVRRYGSIGGMKQYEYNPNLYNAGPLGRSTFAAIDNWNTSGKYSNRSVPTNIQMIRYDGSRLRTDPDLSRFYGASIVSNVNRLVRNFETSPGGNYKSISSGFANLGNSYATSEFNYNNGSGSFNALNNYYKANKVNQWDYARNNTQPPTGSFDAQYYFNNNPSVRAEYNNAVNRRVYGRNVPDLDITWRFNVANRGIKNFANYKYGIASNYGTDLAVRGNAPEEDKAVDEYFENFASLTDREQQRYRDTLLGLGEDYEDSDELEFGEENSQLITDFLTGEGSVGALAQKDQEKFRSTVRFTLNETLAKMKEARRKEYELDLYKGLPGFDEVFSVNETLVNSLYGDSGVGGYLSILGLNVDELSQNLEEQLGGATGVNTNSAQVNWQKWMDTNLIPKLQELETLDKVKPKNMTEEEEAEWEAETYEIDEQFKENYIEKYIKPRFNTSRSMEEFSSYLDVQQDEENVLQTQTTLNALTKDVVRGAQEFYSSLSKVEGTSFNAAYYLDPLAAGYKTVSPVKRTFLESQKARIAADWKDAQDNPKSKPKGTYKGPDGTTYSYDNPNGYTWEQLSYMYGIPIGEGATPNDDFARLHYQTLGQVYAFDPAEDVVTEQDVQEAMDAFIAEAGENYEKGGKIPFLDFVTPAQFADAILQGVNPLENKEDWQKILEAYGLDETATLSEVRKFIEDSLRTGAAEDIREGLKYLNEKKLRPTQARLGVTYIEREEDYKTIDDPDRTELYKLFQNAGYAGNEDQFYEEFMPDVSKSEQRFLTDFMKGKTPLSFADTDLSDPFESLASLDAMFGTRSNEFGTADDRELAEKERDERDRRSGNYFDLFPDIDKDYDREIDKGIEMDFASFFG